MSDFFISNQAGLEEKIKEWSKDFPEYFKVDHHTSYEGLKVYALTVSNFAIDKSKKKCLYIGQPHAHEPATTAGMIDLIEQLLKSRNLEGRNSRVVVGEVLKNLVITFNPIGNPQGRENSPHPYWDGSKVSNQEFLCIAFGEDPQAPKQKWKRVDRWDIREESPPNPIGIAYEQIDAFRYVEPNRSPESSYFKLFKKMDSLFHYDYWLEMHQTEFDWCSDDCVVLKGAEQPPSRAKEINEWAHVITESWLDAGFHPGTPMNTPYTGTQADYFKRLYSEICQRLNRIMTEVKNNSTDFGPDRQLEANVVAIESTIKWIMKSSP